MSHPTPRQLAATILTASAEFQPDETLVFSIVDDNGKPIEIELTACEFVGKCIVELIHSGEIPNYYGVSID